MDAQKNPYIGPRTFQRDEGHLFFGREREARDLISLVASERLVVFYAQSGAGKSSIVNTRLIPNLDEKQYEVLPVGRVSGDSGEGLQVNNIYIYNLLRSLEQHAVDPATLAKLTLAQFLCQLNYDDKGFFYDPALPDSIPGGDDETVVRRALIIDQFEELFSTHPEAWEKREDFFMQAAQAMQDDPHLWLVLVMREDYIAALDPYAHLASNGLRVRYYMQRLGHEAGLKAVKSPVEGIRPYAEGVAEKLIDDLCSIKVQQPDGTLDVQPGQYVEPVQMQVVCYGLWDNLSPDGAEITEQDLQDVGDVNQSLGKYYDRRVAEVAKAKNVRERMIREWFEKKLITAGGIRNMVLQEREPKPGELGDDVIQALQSDLVRGEKRGGATWYELTYDRLVEPIVTSNHTWFDEHLSPVQKQAALWDGEGRKDSWLLTDQALVEVEQWAQEHPDEITDLEQEFLEACQAQQAEKRALEDREAERKELESTKKLMDEQARSARIARRFSVVAAALMVVAVVASFFAFRQTRAVDAQRAAAEAAQAVAEEASNEAMNQANVALSGQLSAFALNKLSSQPDLAILLSLAADKLHSDINSRNALLTMQQENAAVKSFLSLEMPPEEVQFSPDGAVVVSRDETGVTFWDADILEKLNGTPFNGHYSGVTAWALSQDGTLMASGGVDGTIVIWDAIQRKPISGPFKAHKHSISRLVFNREGTKLASASWEENGIILWDITNRAAPQEADEPLLGHTAAVTSLAFSPDDTTLASGGNDSIIILWDVEAREPIGDPLAGHAEAIYGLAFTGDGKTLVSGSYDDTVILWDVSDLTEPRQIGDPLIGPEIDIENIAISPDNTTVASGDDNGNIFLWDISHPRTPTSIGTLYGGTSWVVSLAFSSDGKTLVSGSMNGKVILWDLVEQTKIGETLSAHKNAAVRGLAFLPESETLITASEDSFITFWDITDLENPKADPNSLQGHLGFPTGIRFSSDGSLLASLGDEGTIFLDVATQQKLGYGDFVPTPANNDIFAYQIAQSDKITVYIKEIAGGVETSIPIPGTNPVLSPDGKTLVYQTAGADAEPPQLHLWDVTANKELASWVISGLTPVFSSDGQILAYYTRDSETGVDLINLWDIAESQALGEPLPGIFLGISSDKKILTYTRFDPEIGAYLIEQFDVTNARVQGESLLDNGYSISANGNVLAAPYFDEITQVWSTKVFDMTLGKELDTDGREAELAALSSDGRFLFYRTYGPSGNKDSVAFINLLDTGSGVVVGDPIEGDLLRNLDETPKVFQAGPVLAFEVQDADANSQMVFIDTSSNTQIDSIDEAFYRGQSRDGGILVYQSGNEITLLDTTTQLEIGQAIKGDYLGIGADGKTLASDNGNGLITFWDLSRSWPLGTPVKNAPENVSRAELSPDGSTLAWMADDGLMVRQETLSGGPYNDHQTASISGTYPALSLNGKLLAVGDYDPGRVILWDLNTGRQIGEEFPCCWPALSPDGTLLATGDFTSETTTVWDVDTHQPVWEQLPGVFPAFSANGQQLAIGNRGTNTTAFLDLSTGEPVGTGLPGVFPAFSPDGSLVAVGDWSSSTTTIWDVNTYTPVGDPIPGVVPAFSPDGILAVGSLDLQVTVLWDLETHEPVGEELLEHPFAAFSPNGKVLAAGSENTHITRVWSFDAGTIGLEPIKEFRALPEDFVLSTNGNYIASILPDDVVIRDMAANSSRHVDFDEHAEPLIGPISFYAADSRLAAISADGTLLTWDVDSGKLLIPDEENQPPQLQAATIKTFSPSGDYLAYFSGSDINVWDVRNGKLYARLKEAEIEKSLGTLAFSPDEKWLAYSDGPKIAFWDVQAKKLREDTLQTEAVDIYGLDLITDSIEITYIVATDESNVTQIWDWESRTKIGNPMPDLNIVGLDISNQFAYYLDRNDRLVQWQWGTDLTNLLCPLVKRNFTQEEWNRYFPGQYYPVDNLTCPEYPAGQ